MPDERAPLLAAWLGWSLLLSAAVAWVGAYLDSERQNLLFHDNLDNEVSHGSDATLLLVVLGVILAVNGVVLLAWARARR
jgi:hypothetical protein